MLFKGWATIWVSLFLLFTDLSTFRGAFRGVRRESGLLTGFFGKGKLREGVLIMQENKQHTT